MFRRSRARSVDGAVDVELKTYVILRRSGWRSRSELEEATERAIAVGERMVDDVRWIRSYVLAETDGSVGAVCVYEAASPEAIRLHARRAAFPVDEIIGVAETLVVHPDPVRVCP
jgi:Nickel responsive protein SCO4226-like